MKLKKYLFIIVLTLLALFINRNQCSASSSLELKALDYNVTLNSDGTVFVTEIWDISIEDTNTLFKTFEIDNSKYSGIKNVTVTETTNGTSKKFSQIYTEKYHVDKNCFYALRNSKGLFEIAWGVHEDDSYARRRFEISYTIVDGVKNYLDCSEFYWQFINNTSAIPAKLVRGNITLPSNVLNIEDLRVWAHGPLYGTIEKTSPNSVYFEVSPLNTHTMLEARVVCPTYVFSQNENTSNVQKLSSILEQEGKWADEANQKRARYERMQKIIKIAIIVFFIATNILGLILAIILIKKISKYKKELEDAPNYKPQMPSKYYRDIPNESDSPAIASFLYFFKTSSMSLHISNVFSSIMLNLALKKYLEFDMIPNKKNQIKVIIKPNMDKELLPKEERNILELLEKVSPNGEFTMKDFEKYCKRHTSSFNSAYNSIEKEAKNEAIKLEFYNKEQNKLHDTYSTKGAGFLLLTILSIFTMWLNIIPSIICMVYCFNISGRYFTLTQKGVDEKEKWQGLKNYMSDFSMMNEKEVPELILWEKYLVYATAFGIADKVLKQLKVIYPQFSDENYLRTNGYTYLYFMSYNNMNSNFINTINYSISNTYGSINSSGSGGGGGFSGGGGFGGGGRPEWVEDS